MRYAALLVLAGSALTVLAQPSTPRYSEVTLSYTEQALRTLSQHGIGLDHPIIERGPTGHTARVILNEYEMAQLAATSIAFDVNVHDLEHAYAARSLARGPSSPLPDFEYGSMGGYYTFDEIIAELDSMRADHPSLVSERVSIGQSIEGRDLWMVRISDNPDVDEDEPEALYTALHHAREPQSMATVLFFMHYLLANYGSDPEVTALVDDIEFYFVPVLNPDGYVYNESTNPDGGGLWRKNRRDNGGNVFGVDLNRNYGYLWGLNDIGSSPVPSASTYRGAAPFSEPEIAALRDFIEAHSFRTALNYHSRGEEYLYPWGYEAGTYTEDDDLYFTTSLKMSADNGYEFGTGADVLYGVNGSSDDWMYGEQLTKPKIIAWTPEVCNRTTDGFWPPIERIIPIAEENILANLTVARLARDLGSTVGIEPTAPESEMLAAYPNPARSGITVAVPNRTQRMVLTDALGREVRVMDAGVQSETKVHVDVSDLVPGLYFVSVVMRDGTRTTQPVTVVR